MKPSLFRGTLFIVSLCAAGVTHAQTAYQFTDLYNGFANGINDTGTVVGFSYQGAMIWSNGNASVLPQSYHGDATAINDQGEIVGDMMLPQNTPTATIWSATPTGANFVANLPAPGGVSSYAYGVNNAGVVVGGFQPATMWHGTASTILGDAGTATSGYANGVNASGVIVGDAFGTPYGMYNTVAVEWNGTTATLLPSLGRGGSAQAINDAGVIVGASNIDTTYDSTSTAVEWKNGKVITLNSLGGNLSQANAINSLGQVVGFSSNAAGTSYATLWNGTTAINLNNYLPASMTQAGWVMNTATGINNKGWIIGDVYNAGLGESDAFLLKVSPVPEPETWAMLLLGLGLVGAMAKRRRI
jgi:probable HAF family extracellular repeat protein